MTPACAALLLLFGAAHALCVSLFHSEPKPFDVCLDKPCFIVRIEHPFVFLDPSMRTEQDQRPFPCIRSVAHYPELHGAFLDIVREIPELVDAHCVWTGPNCSYHQMLDFLRSNASSRGHRWIAGGLLFVTLSRMSNMSIPSAAVLEDYLHVVGPPVDTHTTPRQAWNTVWRTFTPRAWLFMGCCAIAHLLMRVWMCWRFRKDGRTFNDMFTEKPRHNPRYANWNRVNAWWWLISAVAICILLLLLEVAIAVSETQERWVAPLRNLPTSQFALIKDSTMESLFEKMVGHRTQHHAFSTQREQYAALLNGKLKYTLAYRSFNQYIMNIRPELCEKLRLYDHVPSKLAKGRQPPPITGAWFYSGNVPPEERMRFDRGIVRLKEKGRIQEIVSVHSGSDLPQRCRLNSTSIDWLLIALLAVLPAAMFLLLVLCLVYFGFSSIWIFLNSIPRALPPPPTAPEP